MVSRILLHYFLNTSSVLINVSQENTVWDSGYPCFTDTQLKHQKVYLTSHRRFVSEPGTEPMYLKSYYFDEEGIPLSFLLPLS